MLKLQLAHAYLALRDYKNAYEWIAKLIFDSALQEHNFAMPVPVIPTDVGFFREGFISLHIKIVKNFKNFRINFSLFYREQLHYS